MHTEMENIPVNNPQASMRCSLYQSLIVHTKMENIPVNNPQASMRQSLTD